MSEVHYVQLKPATCMGGSEQHVSQERPFSERPAALSAHNVSEDSYHHISPSHPFNDGSWFPGEAQPWQTFETEVPDESMLSLSNVTPALHDVPFEVTLAMNIYSNIGQFEAVDIGNPASFYPAAVTAGIEHENGDQRQPAPQQNHPHLVIQTANPQASIPTPTLSFPDTPIYQTYSHDPLKVELSRWQTLSPQDPAAFDTRREFLTVPASTTLPTIETSCAQLQWPSETQINSQSCEPSSFPTMLSKRKRASPEAPKKRSRADEPEKALSKFVVVFENAPGALSTVKHRRKLDAPVRKSARDVRKAGACHQCRFRKRTCSTGTPCISCLKNGNGLHEVKCQRESPFVGKPMHQYFEFSSTKRVVYFNVVLPPEALSEADQETITIDGVGGVSRPIKLCGRKKAFSTLSAEQQEAVKRTSALKETEKSSDNDQVLLLEDTSKLGQEIEQWAMEYTSQFVHAAGSEFYSTTMAQILGTAYVKKGLPESKLVLAMLRVASLAFVLRAGVRATTTNKSQSKFRTIQARIDTILYERLQVAETILFHILQRMIFRTAGCLTRTQIFPVALVLWQLLRIFSISSSHLSNITQKFQSKAHAQADYQFIGLRLLLSTHMALFRTSNPLLLDMNESQNRDLVGDDDEIIALCGKMRNVVLNFREKGLPKMKGSIAYKKEYFDMFRKVYTGM
ncbi:hypothetical protein BJ875DRAFT_134464 [Amylocarpus encephaloides]|uniref:Zn(2)-C6 fungal-type domain-containing protein n=1 Tax=Amylocarpus encephaloides TaxID=45428 RepID=A0A9P7YCM7_9HELO|nr:hypothetical protein BJ875DRAFT_134464 [Amylocarpus encephaloides]